MPPRIPEQRGRAAVHTWASAPGAATRAVLATAVRYTLQQLADTAPGHAVEVRIPPFGVTQCLPGPRHTRGTPPAVVETDPQTWLQLATGALTWPDAMAGGRVRAGGRRADLAPHLPLPGSLGPDD